MSRGSPTERWSVAVVERSLRNANQSDAINTHGSRISRNPGPETGEARTPLLGRFAANRGPEKGRRLRTSRKCCDFLAMRTSIAKTTMAGWGARIRSSTRDDATDQRRLFGRLHLGCRSFQRTEPEAVKRSCAKHRAPATRTEFSVFCETSLSRARCNS